MKNAALLVKMLSSIVSLTGAVVFIYAVTHKNMHAQPAFIILGLFIIALGYSLYKSLNKIITKKPVVISLEAKLYMDIHNSERECTVCPNCDAEDSFLKGPSAGVCQNIKCSNCGKNYNVSMDSSFKFAEEIS